MPDEPFGADPWLLWSGGDVLAHPGSPAGGGGPGHFRTPGPLGLTDSTSPLPHPRATATRALDASAVAVAHEQSGFSGWLGRVVGADDWAQLKVIAEALLGPQSFGVGVCVGIVKNPIASVAALLELEKTFILADLCDQLEQPQSWRALLPGLLPGHQAVSLGARGLLALGFIDREDLLSARAQRDALIEELKEVIAHPVEFLTGLPAKIADEYRDKFQRFSALKGKTDLVSQYQAGEILGDVLMDVVMTIAGFVSGVGTAARLASKVPQLAKAARLFRSARRAGGMTKGAASAEAAEATAAGRVTKVAGPEPAPVAAEPPKPKLAPPPTKPVRPKAPPTPKGPPKLPGVTAQDRALAASPGASPAQIQARQKLTKTFLEEYGREWQGPPPGQYVKMNDAEVLSQMKGHDFTKPITCGPPPPVGPDGAGTVYQWQRPNGGQGQYYADAASTPESLGIANQASDGSGNLVNKVQVKYTADPEAPYLQSTAAPAVDTWSVRGQEIATPGGNTQWVVGERTMLTK